MKWGIYRGYLRRPTAALLEENRAAAALLSSFGVNYHHRLPGIDTVEAAEAAATLDAIADAGLEVGVHPLSPTTEWDRERSARELERCGFLRGQRGVHDVYLGHEVYRYLDRERRGQLLGLCGRQFPGMRRRLYYGYAPKVWYWKTEFGRDEPHVIHIAANQGAAADIEVIYAAPEGMLAAVQAARDHMERLTVGGHQWFVHLNVRASDAAERIASALRVLARLRPDGLLVRVADEKGGTLEAGENVLEGIRLARVEVGGVE